MPQRPFALDLYQHTTHPELKYMGRLPILSRAPQLVSRRCWPVNHPAGLSRSRLVRKQRYTLTWEPRSCALSRSATYYTCFPSRHALLGQEWQTLAGRERIPVGDRRRIPSRDELLPKNRQPSGTTASLAMLASKQAVAACPRLPSRSPGGTRLTRTMRQV